MSKEYTGFGNIKADSVIAGSVVATGGALSKLKVISLEKTNNYALTAAERAMFVTIAISAASKALTLGMGDGEVMVVYNSGDTNAVTVKNLAADTGSSLAVGKMAFVFGSSTANGTKIVVLN